MEQLAKEQRTVGDSIQQIISNYNKDSAARKNLKYYEDRLQRLEEQWAIFDKNDSSIRSLSDVQVGHSYFKQEYYAAISSIYERYRRQFEEKIEVLKAEQDNDPSPNEKSNPELSENPGSSRVSESPTPEVKTRKVKGATVWPMTIPESRLQARMKHAMPCA